MVCVGFFFFFFFFVLIAFADNSDELISGTEHVLFLSTADFLLSEIITSLEKPGYVAGLWRAQSDRVRRDVVRQVPQNEELRRAVSPFIPTPHARKCKDRPGVAQGCHQYDWAYYFQVRLLGLGMISRFWSKIL